MPEIFRLFQCVLHLHREGTPPQDYTNADLQIAFATLYPQSRLADYAPLFKSIEEDTANAEGVEDYLSLLRKRGQATKLISTALAFTEGRGSEEELQTVFEELRSPSVVSNNQVSDFVNDNLEYLYQKQVLKAGLRWRLGSLNQTLGSLRDGDFGFIFARPESGKTTFLASEVPFMAHACTGPVLWFNNEEQSEKVLLRCYQSVNNCDLPTLYSKMAQHQAIYTEFTGGRIRMVDAHSLQRADLEQLCARYSPSLIVIDQLDKVGGFANDRNDLELKSIYQWARTLAARYGAVIGVCQAGQTGEGKRYLGMNDVDNSKTGKQGEADWILGIGKAADDGLESYRYLHLSKNKLQGDNDTDPARRHDSWEVRLNALTARYEDL